MNFRAAVVEVDMNDKVDAMTDWTPSFLVVVVHKEATSPDALPNRKLMGGCVIVETTTFLLLCCCLLLLELPLTVFCAMQDANSTTKIMDTIVRRQNLSIQDDTTTMFVSLLFQRP
jgi:hypothetical protein